MKLVFIWGDSAVGKMTVGQELMKITDLRLFHNHMSIEMVLEVFGGFVGNASSRIREVVFEEFAASDLYGMIFTYMMAFDVPSEWEYIEHVMDIFRERKKDAQFYFVELIASQEVRLERNGTENRLKNKASKRDVETSNQRLIRDNERYRLVSNEGEIPYENYLRINNEQLAPETAAQMIKERFGL